QSRRPPVRAEGKYREPYEQHAERDDAGDTPEEHRHGTDVDETHVVGRLDRARPAVVIRVVVPGRDARPGLQYRAGRVALHDAHRVETADALLAYVHRLWNPDLAG